MSSMRAAHQSISAKAYDDAARYSADALRAQPNDPAAIELLNQANSQVNIARAAELGKQGYYFEGVQELEKALAATPDNEQAKQMMVDFKLHEPEQTGRMER